MKPFTSRNVIFRAMFGFGLALSLSLPVQAAQRSDTAAPTLDAQDQAFVAKASADNTMQVELAQLAQQRSHSDSVHALARRIIEDHTALNARLSHFSTGKKGRSNAHGASEREILNRRARLKQLSGDAFDQAFAKLMVQDHEQAIATYKKAAHSSADAKLRDIARDGLPLLQAHLKAARAIVAAGQTGHSG